jgi:hypothetical protein
MEHSKARFTQGKIRADICANNCTSKTLYLKKIHIKTFKLAKFWPQMSALILPHVYPAFGLLSMGKTKVSKIKK